VVTNFHRCNVWFPRSARDSSELSNRRTSYLDYRSLTGYWTELCRNYDRLGEFQFRATPKFPTQVPVLSWVGSLDTFDPEGTRARFMRLSSMAQFEVMPGWSHDFGVDTAAGVQVAAQKIEKFLDLR
jgi:hypothetical protein